jgi:hypothetical protein
MSATPDDESLNIELDVLARRAGLEIPADRRDALLEGFRDLKKLLAVLRAPREATSEIAGVFDPRSITRTPS